MADAVLAITGFDAPTGQSTGVAVHSDGSVSTWTITGAVTSDLRQLRIPR